MGSHSGVISRVIIVITRIRGRLTPLITTHEPPSAFGTYTKDLNKAYLRKYSPLPPSPLPP